MNRDQLNLKDPNECLSLFTVADYFGCKGACKVAKQALEEREKDFSPSLRIRIACTFSPQFDHFVEGAAKDLLKNPLGSFNTEDKANLDRREVAALMKA